MREITKTDAIKFCFYFLGTGLHNVQQFELQLVNKLVLDPWLQKLLRLLKIEISVLFSVLLFRKGKLHNFLFIRFQRLISISIMVENGIEGGWELAPLIIENIYLSSPPHPTTPTLNKER